METNSIVSHGMAVLWVKGGAAMTAKEFLSQAYRIDLRINSKMEQIRSLRSLAEKASNILSPVPYSGTRNVHRLEDVIVKIVDLESEINVEIETLMETKRAIAEALSLVTQSDYRTLLELRYICCLTWEEIAGELHVSVRSVHRIHGNALNEITVKAEKYFNN